MTWARVIIDRDFTVGRLNSRMFGSFLEQMGRSVYGGIYDPTHPTADANGFRGDVLDLVRELRPTIIRYPGGNFLSGYDWLDGVGPRAERPKRLDLSRSVTETNEFGTNEFIDWCRKAGIEPMLAINLGTGGMREALAYLEYCNHPGNSRWSDLRRAHGYAEPHRVKFWCLGNEQDAPWQIGAKSPDEYGRLAAETAKAMKIIDPTIEISVCGSSNRDMPLYGEWERVVMEHCFEHVDYIAPHVYFLNPHEATSENFANVELMDLHIREVAAVCDAVAARRRSLRRTQIAFDEWNIYARSRPEDARQHGGWPERFALIEDTYSGEDALIVAGALQVLINNADRVHCACFAQVVNVIAPIRAEEGGPAWRQTIFWPLALMAEWARGTVLRQVVQGGTYASRRHPQVAYLHSAVTWDEDTRQLAVFALNRHPSEHLELTLDARRFGRLALREARELADFALGDLNGPDAASVAPKAKSGVEIAHGTVVTALKPLSWTMLVLESTADEVG